MDLIGGYDCSCMDGFEKKSDQCGDVNECVKNNPCVNGICINLPGKYKCFCRVSVFYFSFDSLYSKTFKFLGFYNLIKKASQLESSACSC